MFHHGRGYSHRTVFFIVLNLYKVWNRIWSVWALNGANSMSGVTDSYGLMFALYAVVFCNFLGVWWVATNVEIDQKTDERSYWFHMSDLYSYCRKDILKYYHFYFVMVVWSAVPVALSSGVFY